MKTKLAILLAAVLSCGAQEITIPANLKGWYLSNKQNIRTDKETKLSQGQSLLVENDAFAIMTLELEKGKQYLLKFSVKGESLDKGARIIINSPGVNRWYPISTFADKRVDKGTFDWKRDPDFWILPSWAEQKSL